MIIFISGKMAGLNDMGRTHFLAADKALSQAGHTVLNPATLPAGMPEDSYMPICLAMLNAAEAIFMLTGYEYSKGADLEYRFASYQDKTIYHETCKADCEALGIEAKEKPGSAHTCVDCEYYSDGTRYGYCNFDGTSRYDDTTICKYFKPKEGSDDCPDQ